MRLRPFCLGIWKAGSQKENSQTVFWIPTYETEGTNCIESRSCTARYVLTQAYSYVTHSASTSDSLQPYYKINLHMTFTNRILIGLFAIIACRRHCLHGLWLLWRQRRLNILSANAKTEQVFGSDRYSEGDKSGCATERSQIFKVTCS